MGLVSSFRIVPEHLVERHGLLVIIALGESVVAIGMGVDVEHLTAGTLAVVVLALALPAGLWWTYFTDTRATEARLVAAEPGPRVRLALRTGFAHIPLMLGVVITAAGIHTAVAHPGDPSSWPAALALAGGVVVFSPESSRSATRCTPLRCAAGSSRRLLCSPRCRSVRW